LKGWQRSSRVIHNQPSESLTSTPTPESGLEHVCAECAPHPDRAALVYGPKQADWRELSQVG
jgi:hypothetical protein